MSQIIDYIRNLFNPTDNFTRKRRRTDFAREEIEPVPKYKRVTNVFPKEYKPLRDDEIDYFREVNRKRPLYNGLLENFLMDQQQKHMKAVLEDGEFSDEDDLNSYRMPSTGVSKSHKPSEFNFKRFYDADQPSSSTAFNQTKKNNSKFTNGRKLNGGRDDDDVQFVSISSKSNSSRPFSREMPSLIPISKTFQPSIMTNGFSRENSLKPVASQPSRGRRSVLDFLGKNRAFGDAPKIANSIIDRRYNMETKSDYERLLNNLIPRYPTGALKVIQQVNEARPVATIDLSDDNDSRYNKENQQASVKEFPAYRNRKSEVVFKPPATFVDISDDEIDQSHFIQEPCLSSTQVIKARDNEHNLSANKSKERIVPIVQLPPVNTLKERQSFRESLKNDTIEKIVERFNQKREEKDRSITEEILNASKFEKERIEHEKIQQKRIDESITSALADKCIIIEEEEEVIDEFPPLNEQQLRFVQYALHGNRNEVIVSKFNMNITRHDLATLDGLNWLNDEVINFYMELIKERSEQVEHLPKVHVMNTFFLGKLLQQGHSGVRRWTRKIDIFSYDIIPIPVHVGGVHWCMSIIHLKNKTIRYYDSMGHPNHVVLEALEQYLKDESMDKRKIPFDTSDWTIECVRDCPQQKNGSDCGVFSCQFAEFISRDSTVSFEQQHMQYFRRKMICEIGNGRLFLGH
ncbi:sentrin-specific protease-like isoform X2 [Chironomus tepperi]|uniref:sentrin-specific protease-like isoform X2 n=1 Tax=Chironomus tepperi TaxID=113505 RepID=UPI00391FC3FC